MAKDNDGNGSATVIPSGGWIKLWKQSLGTSLYPTKRGVIKEPFTEWESWIDILLNAAHKERNSGIGKKAIVEQRGEWKISLRQLSERWGWSFKKVRNYLRNLEESNMIIAKKRSRAHLGAHIPEGIFVTNFDIYQCTNYKKGTLEGTLEGTLGDNSENGIPGNEPPEPGDHSGITSNEDPELESPKRVPKKGSPLVSKEYKNKYYVGDSEPLRLATLLKNLVLERKPNYRWGIRTEPDLQAWARQLDLMIRRDGRTPAQIERVIRWCQEHGFWSKNICSADKLREKFTRLEDDMESPQKPKFHEPKYRDVTGEGFRDE